MIELQPLYILGMEDEEHCKESAFGAMILFIITFVGSLTFNWYDSMNKERWQALSQDDTHELLPRGMSSYNFRTDSELELMGVDTPSPSYHGSVEEDFAPPAARDDEPIDLLDDLPPIS